ncbi:unnamed protein product, partial [Symbiodinium microadriaticum]
TSESSSSDSSQQEASDEVASDDMLAEAASLFGLRQKDLLRGASVTRLDDLSARQLAYVVSGCTSALPAADVLDLGGQLESHQVDRLLRARKTKQREEENEASVKVGIPVIARVGTGKQLNALPLTNCQKQSWNSRNFEKILTDTVQKLSQEASKELQDCLLGNESKRKAVTEEPARHKRMNRGGLKPPASPEEESQEEAEEDAESKPKTRGSGRHAKDGEDGDDDDDEDDDDEDADLFAGPFNCQTPAKSKGLGLLDNLTPKQQKLAESFEPGLRKTFPEDFSRSDFVWFMQILNKEEIHSLLTAMDVCQLEGDLSDHLGESEQEYKRMSLRGKRLLSAWQKKVLALQAFGMAERTWFEERIRELTQTQPESRDVLRKKIQGKIEFVDACIQHGCQNTGVLYRLLTDKDAVQSFRARCCELGLLLRPQLFPAEDQSPEAPEQKQQQQAAEAEATSTSAGSPEKVGVGLQVRGCKPPLQQAALDCLVRVRNYEVQLDSLSDFLDFTNLTQRWNYTKLFTKGQQKMQTGIKLHVLTWFLLRVPFQDSFQDISYSRLQRRLIHRLSQAAEKCFPTVLVPELPVLQADHKMHPAKKGGGLVAATPDQCLLNMDLKGVLPVHYSRTIADFYFRYLRKTSEVLGQEISKMTLKSLSILCVWLPVLCCNDFAAVGTLQKLAPLHFSEEQLLAVHNCIQHVGFSFDQIWPEEGLRPIDPLIETRLSHEFEGETRTYVHNAITKECHWEPLNGEHYRLVLAPDEGSSLFTGFMFLASKGAAIGFNRDERNGLMPTENEDEDFENVVGILSKLVKPPGFPCPFPSYKAGVNPFHILSKQTDVEAPESNFEKVLRVDFSRDEVTAETLVQQVFAYLSCCFELLEYASYHRSSLERRICNEKKVTPATPELTERKHIRLEDILKPFPTTKGESPVDASDHFWVASCFQRGQLPPASKENRCATQGQAKRTIEDSFRKPEDSTKVEIFQYTFHVADAAMAAKTGSILIRRAPDSWSLLVFLFRTERILTITSAALSELLNLEGLRLPKNAAKAAKIRKLMESAAVVANTDQIFRDRMEAQLLHQEQKKSKRKAETADEQDEEGDAEQAEQDIDPACAACEQLLAELEKEDEADLEVEATGLKRVHLLRFRFNWCKIKTFAQQYIFHK